MKTATLIKLVASDEAKSHAAKMGLTVEELKALRKHPDKAWARAEAKRLLAKR